MANRGLNQLFARKSVEQMHAEHDSSQLKRTLGPLNLILLGIGCIIGTGIFVLTGRAAAEFAGPGIMISFIITGTLCAFVALCYAELASAIPVSGSAYSYSYASMGEMVAWIMGILLVLEYGLAASTVAVGWSGNVIKLLVDLNIHFPHALTQAPGMMIATGDIHTTVVDPTVNIAGSTAVLSDGTRAVFHDATNAVFTGTQKINFSAYDVIGKAAFDLNSHTPVILSQAAEVIDQVSQAKHHLDAGTSVVFLDDSGSTGIFSADAVKALGPVAGAMTPSMFNLPAVIGIVAVTTLLVVGISESALVNNIVVFIKVGIVLSFIIVCAPYVHPQNWVPLVPPQSPPPPAGSDMSLWGQIFRAIGDVFTGKSTAHYGVGGLISGAATIFFAYIGFEAVSTAGAESKNPARDMPIGILGSLIICTILYILTSAVLVGIVDYRTLNDAAPLAKATKAIGLGWFATLVEIGAIAGLSSVMLVLLYGQTRIFYTMARDGLIPKVFAQVHPKFKTPWINTIAVGLLAAVFAGGMSLDTLGNVTNVGSLAAFAIICITVFYLRIARPDMPRPFKMPTPVTLVVAVLGTVMCLFLLKTLMNNPETRNFFLIYSAIGFVVYFAYGMWNSKLAKGEIVGGHEPNPDLAVIKPGE